MADVTILPSGIASQTGWATGAFTDIDEGISAADGNLLSTDSDGEGETFTLDFDSPGLTDADTITQMDVIVRHGTGGVDTTGGQFLTGTTWPFTGTPAQPDNKPWKKEWAKFREEFVRKLLADVPKGIISFKQVRVKSGTNINIKVEIEYTPDDMCFSFRSCTYISTSCSNT